MPRVIEKTVFKFDELSDRAKERARDWYREASAGDNYFSESVIEDAACMADMFGLDLNQRPAKLMSGATRYEPAIYWSGFSSQGDGASFEASYSYKKGGAKAVKAEAPQDSELHRIVDALQSIQQRYGYKIKARISQSGRYSHEMTMRFNFELDEDREIAADDEEALAEAFRDYARWIYRNLEKEYDFQNSDETVDETIRANEYEFDEDGRLT